MERSSPTTSERTRETTRAGAAARARPPPLRRERCLRTVFSSPMVAPARRSSQVTTALSSRVMPGTGAGSRAEAPPEMRTSSRSSLSRPRASPSTAVAASSPRRSGSGWRATRTCVRCSVLREVMSTARASLMRSPSTSSAAWAMVPAALPAAATTSRRPGRKRWRTPATDKLSSERWRWRLTSRAGSAALRPADRMALAASRRRLRSQRDVDRGRRLMVAAEDLRESEESLSVPSEGRARSAA